MANIWMVRAGEQGYLIKDFTRGYVALGYKPLGDMTSMSDQSAIRNKYIASYPDVGPGVMPNQVAIFYKFRTVMQIGDDVITYDPQNREYLLGKILSDYYYKPNEITDYSHLRKVKWEYRVSRDKLSANTRNSLGSTLAIFSLNEEVWSEIQSVLKGSNTSSSEEVGEEEEKLEIQQLKEDTFERARELIKDKILKLDSREMEQLVAAILRSMGYKTRITPIGPDRGVDVFASPDGLGLVQPRIKAEVKHRQRTQMSPQDVRSFLGGLREGDKGLYVSTGGFSTQAKYEAERSNIPVTLIDLDDLTELVVSNYEKFDLEGCALIPLVKIYWPAE